MIRRRLTWGEPDGLGLPTPRLIVEARGLDDVYRIARQLEHGANGPARTTGRRILRSLEDHEPGIVLRLTRRLGPLSALRELHRQARRRQVQLRLGMSEAEIREVEEAIR